MVRFSQQAPAEPAEVKPAQAGHSIKRLACSRMVCGSDAALTPGAYKFYR